MAREKATGKIPNGFDDLCVFVPSERQIICIQEGSGDNLSDEDLDEGYVDYIYYTQYSLEDFEEEDGGMMLLTELVQEKYKRLADCLPDLMDFIYDDPKILRFILS